MLNIRSIIDDIFREESSLPSRVDSVEFVSRHHTTVYRVRAAGATYVVHATPHTSEDLGRIRSNLRLLEALSDDRIPRVLAFRNAGEEAPLTERWALLVMTHIPGDELSSRSFGLRAWSSLCDLMMRVHALPAGTSHKQATNNRVDDAAAFADFAETLLVHLRDLPLRVERVRAHLSALSDYLTRNASSFSICSRLIHGDINRENIRVDGERAGVIDWSDLGAGDYAYDLATLKFALDSVVPRSSTSLIGELARSYRNRFDDDTIELRLRFFLALPGLVSAFWYANESALFREARAWRVRTCYLHSEAQWKTPLRLDGAQLDSPVIRTEHWALRIPQPARGLFYLLAPKRVA